MKEPNILSLVFFPVGKIGGKMPLYMRMRIPVMIMKQQRRWRPMAASNSR